MSLLFHGWDVVMDWPLDKVADLILTGHKATDSHPYDWMYHLVGNKAESLTILDFGCGMGRNTFGLSQYSPKWTIMGFDNTAMIRRSTDFYRLHYGEKIPKNVWFSTDWEELTRHQFDVIFCSLVLQHIYEDDLNRYVNDFKQMAHKLVVLGRRFNDDVPKRSTWMILEENGLHPVEFYKTELIDTFYPVPYQPFGPAEEHHIAIYQL